MQDTSGPGAAEQVRATLVGVIGSLGLGLVLGFLAKYWDNVPVIGEIGTYLGFWILMASLLIAVSKSPLKAALNVLVFFLAMLAAYYAYSMKLFGFFPRRLFLAWSGMSLVSPFAAYILWYARKSGWGSAVCAALPISLLLREGYSFFYTYRPAQGFDILSAAVLLYVLPRSTEQRLRAAVVTIVLFLLIKQIPIFSWLFGGI